LPDKAPSNLKDSLKTTIDIASSPRQLTDYVFTYARPK
jgi:hypothetical protein